MSDLPARLRAATAPSSHEMVYVIEPLLCEAADEIELLRKEVLSAWGVDSPMGVTAIRQAQVEIWELRNENERLRKALVSVDCPRPVNARLAYAEANGWTVEQCCDAKECGCVFGEALK